MGRQHGLSAKTAVSFRGGWRPILDESVSRDGNASSVGCVLIFPRKKKAQAHQQSSGAVRQISGVPGSLPGDWLASVARYGGSGPHVRSPIDRTSVIFASRCGSLRDYSHTNWSTTRDHSYCTTAEKKSPPSCTYSGTSVYSASAQQGRRHRCRYPPRLGIFSLSIPVSGAKRASLALSVNRLSRGLESA